MHTGSSAAEQTTAAVCQMRQCPARAVVAACLCCANQEQLYATAIHVHQQQHRHRRLTSRSGSPSLSMPMYTGASGTDCLAGGGA
jgi:hypothetical protein